MTAEWVFGGVAAAAAVISAIFGGGLLSRHINHAKELAVTQYRLEETQKTLATAVADIAALKNNSVEVNTKLDQFEDHVKKLELIPDINAKLTAMTELVRGLQSMVTSISNDRRHD